MPELSDFLSCQEIMLTNPNSRPKLVLKINRLSDHYQAFSDVEEKATTNVPESSEKSSLDNNVDTGVGIGYKDIKIIKQSRNKRTAKAVGNKSKTKKAGKGVNASGKVTKAKIMKPLPKPARNLFSCSDASDTDDHLEKAEIKPPCRKFSVCDESKPSITKKAVKVTKAKADRNLSIISDPTCNDVLMAKAIKLDSEPSSVTKNAGSDVDASGKKTKPKIIKPRPKPARNLSILYDTVTVNSDSKLAKAQINQKSKTSSVTKKAGSVVDSNGKKNKAKIIKRRQKPALDLFNCSDTSDSDNQLAKSQMNVTTSSDFGNSKISFGDLSEKDSDSNNEVSLSVKDKVINMNGEVVSKIIHESNNMNNECASSSVKIKSSIDECNNEVSNDLAKNIEECSSNVTNKSIDNKCIIKESNNAETDDSDVISLCADE